MLTRCIPARVPRSWDDLDALFGTQVAREEALIDREDEVWARVLDRFLYRLVVWRDGRVIEPGAEPLGSPVRARSMLYDLGQQLVVEIQPFGRVHRQYMREREYWVVSVDGSAVCESGGQRWFDDRRRESCADPAAAVALAEQRIGLRSASTLATELRRATRPRSA